MENYKDWKPEDIPWTSFGRETPIAKAGRSLVPVGVFPFELKPFDSATTPVVDATVPGSEDLLMNIVGTGIQARDGTVITCAHVIDALFQREPKLSHYILARTFRENGVLAVPYSIQASVWYIDIRTHQKNRDVDLAAMIVPAVSREDLPYEIPPVQWGDSRRLGVGDPVIVGGYPYGKQMFLFTRSNRGLIQPTFYAGIVSAILPATTSNETRLLQLSIPVAGGMSGGAVLLPDTGEVVGMVTSCIHADKVPLPMSYAIPSEIIAPFVENLSFSRGKRNSAGLTGADITGAARK
jgi:S1-C subfamily serine protease